MAKSPFIAVTLFEFTADAQNDEPLHREDVSLVYAEFEEEARATGCPTNSTVRRGTCPDHGFGS
ncbi:hypothetical protein [Nocardia sp. X0981]